MRLCSTTHGSIAGTTPARGRDGPADRRGGAICRARLLRQNPPRVLTFLLQVGAIGRWGSYDRLPQIAAPTLVIHGETDRLVPSQNAKILAERIPGAKLALLPEAGHIFPTDQPKLSREELLKFLVGN